ncbi:hypothetical protein ACEUZ9_000887 [Paracoccus litorisediminis]|uniref:COG3904 family protein n=1 Tax=Paracoccus litorisediminis TaxID=2006130 RepID=UPI00372DDE8A
MTFRVMTSGGNCPTCTWIRAHGMIDDGAAERFREFVEGRKFNSTGGIQVHLSSPGGNLLEGVELGRLIRAYRMSTVVSDSVPSGEYTSGVTRAEPLNYMTTCASACNFAFFGGIVRYASSQTPSEQIGYQQIGRLAAHQFYNQDALIDPDALTRTANDAIADQLIVAHLLTYLGEMGVSAEFLQIASRTPPAELHYLTEEEVLATQADNFSVRDVFIVGYRNGVAITELRYARPDADYRIELYCQSGEIRMLATVSWRRVYGVQAHRSWKIMDGLSLAAGNGESIPATKIEESFSEAVTGTQGVFRFAFAQGSLARIVNLNAFRFLDGSSRYATEAADELSFVLPPGYSGLHILPKTCL